jgi:hypothetical protein
VTGFLSGSAIVSSFDHLVRPCKQVRRNRQVDLLRSLQIDHKFKLRRLLDGEVGWFGTLQDLIDHRRQPPGRFGHVGSIGHQAAAL